MQKSVYIIGLAALIALGVWGWRVLFPNPERVIRSQLSELAETVSFKASEGNISKVLKADRISSYFTLDVEVVIDVPGYTTTATLNGRTDLKQGLLAAHSQLSQLKVEFPDVNVMVNPDKETAVANVTAQTTVGNQRDFHIIELNLLLRKVEGKWMIYRVETVKTLSDLNLAPAPANRIACG